MRKRLQCPFTENGRPGLDVLAVAGASFFGKLQTQYPDKGNSVWHCKWIHFKLGNTVSACTQPQYE